MSARDLELLEDAARAAGGLMLAMRGSARVRVKADGSPVTDADLAVDALLKARLLGARPGYGWLSEETADDPGRLGRERVFVVDPIDGTSAYVRRRPWFCASLAVVERGRPVAAAIYAPETDQMFAAAQGAGAMLNGEPIHASRTQGLPDARVCGDAALLAPPRWPALEVVRRNAIAYRMALVAAGEVDAAVSPSPKWEWDIAAGALIAAEAGAAVTDAGGLPLVFNSPQARCPGLVCCAPGILPDILQRTLISPEPRPIPQAV